MNELRIAALLSLAVSLFALSGCDRSPSLPTTPAQTTSAEPTGDSQENETPAAAADAPTPGKIIETSFDDLELKMERGDPFKESLLTKKVKERFGQKVRLRGYMLSTPRKSGLKEFVLIRDDQECCFGPGSFLFHSVLVRMRGDATAEYSLRPITVEGNFRFDEFLDPISGNHLAIYAIDAELAE